LDTFTQETAEAYKKTVS